MSQEMVAEGHSEAKGSAEELKREQRNAEATTAATQQLPSAEDSTAM